jgi:hypothetical protein
MAAVLAAGPEAVASSFTAAGLWDLVDRDRAAARPGIHITVPGRLQLTGVIAHRAVLVPGDVARRRHIPVLSPSRTIVDIAADPSIGVDELGVVVDGALRRGLVRLGDLRSALVRCGGPGRGRLDALRGVLAGRDSGYEPGANDWERRMDEWWEAAGLTAARRQYRTRVAGRTYIIDRAIVDLRIAVEWNGFATHGQFRSGFDATTMRQLDLVGDGWAYIPVTTRTPLDTVCRAVWTAVRQRSGPP